MPGSLILGAEADEDVQRMCLKADSFLTSVRLSCQLPYLAHRMYYGSKHVCGQPCLLLERRFTTFPPLLQLGDFRGV